MLLFEMKRDTWLFNIWGGSITADVVNEIGISTREKERGSNDL